MITLAQVRENEALFSPDGNAFSLIASSKTEEYQVNFISRSLICYFCKWPRPLFFQNYISLSNRHLSISTGANLTPLWAGANISSLSYPSFIASFKDLFGLHAQLPFPSSFPKEQVLFLNAHLTSFNLGLTLLITKYKKIKLNIKIKENIFLPEITTNQAQMAMPVVLFPFSLLSCLQLLSICRKKKTCITFQMGVLYLITQ